jgi:hypothetical protein
MLRALPWYLLNWVVIDRQALILKDLPT